MNAVTHLLSALAIAQGAAPAGADAQTSFPFVGVVRADRLNVRLSPRSEGDSPIVHILSRGDPVTVVGQEDGFYKIQPPEKSGLWVWSRNLRAEEGGWGVTSTEAPLRLDSRVTAPEITRLPAGTRVQVLRDHLGWNKVRPPDGVYFYVGARYVNRSGNVAPAVAENADAEAEGLMQQGHAAIAAADTWGAQGSWDRADYGAAAEIFSRAAGIAKTEGVRSQAEFFQRQCENMQRLRNVALEAKRQADLARAAAEAANRPPPTPEYNFRGYVSEVGATIGRPTQWRLTTRRGTLETVCYVIIDNPDLVRRWTTQLWGRYVGIQSRNLGRSWQDAPIVRLEQIEPLDPPAPQTPRR